MATNNNRELALKLLEQANQLLEEDKQQEKKKAEKAKKTSPKKKKHSRAYNMFMLFLIGLVIWFFSDIFSNL